MDWPERASKIGNLFCIFGFSNQFTIILFSACDTDATKNHILSLPDYRLWALLFHHILQFEPELHWVSFYFSEIEKRCSSALTWKLLRKVQIVFLFQGVKNFFFYGPKVFRKGCFGFPQFQNWGLKKGSQQFKMIGHLVKTELTKQAQLYFIACSNLWWNHSNFSNLEIIFTPTKTFLVIATKK